MKKSSLRKQKMKRTVCVVFVSDEARNTLCTSRLSRDEKKAKRKENKIKNTTNLVGVVKVQEPALTLVDILVTRVGATDKESSIHVNVVAGEVEGDKGLEENGPSREGRGEEDEQAGGGATVSDHVENGAESGRLLKGTGSVAIEGIEQARNTVEECACSRMEGHVV